MRLLNLKAEIAPPERDFRTFLYVGVLGASLPVSNSFWRGVSTTVHAYRAVGRFTLRNR